MDQETCVHKDPWFWLALICGALILSPTLWYGLGMDQAIYAYGAWVWLKFHLPPYIGSWDANFPGIYIIHLLAMELFGPSILGFRIFDFILQLSALAMIFCLVRRLDVSGKVSFLAVIAYALYYSTRGRWDAGQRDAFIFWVILASVFLFLALASRPWLRAAAVGLLAGFAFLIRPTYGLTWPVIGAFVLMAPGRKKIRLALGHFLLFSACWAAAMLAVTAYYGLSGYGLDPFRDLMAYDFSVYSKVGPARGQLTGIAWAFAKIHGIFSPQPAIAFLGLAGIAYGFARKMDASRLSILRMIAALMLVNVFSYLFMGKDLQYHLIPFWGFMCLLSGMGLDAIGGFIQGRRPGIGGKAAALIFYLVFLAAVYASMPAWWSTFASGYAFRSLHGAYLAGSGGADKLLSEDYYAAADYLKMTAGPQDGIEVFAGHPLISYLARKKLPTRFGCVQYLMFSPDGVSISPLQRKWIAEYTKDVINARPRFFVIADQQIWFKTALSQSTIKTGLRELFPQLDQFLDDNYRPLKKIGDTEIYELAAGPEGARP